MAMSDFTTVSVSKALHRDLKVIAALEGMSINALIQKMLDERKAENQDVYTWLQQQEEPVSGSA